MAENDKPIVSIIMATFNRGHIIRQSIEHIFQQDYGSIELIIINDGSSDNTSEVLATFQEDNKVILIENDQNLGLQKSLNKGISKASGKYIARIDDHDRWIQKDKLSQQVIFLEANPKVGVLGTAYKIKDQIFQNRLTDQSIRQQILFRCPICHVTTMIRKSVIDEVGGYDEALTYSEDWEMWLKIGNHAQLANLEAVTTEVVTGNNSLTSDFFLKQIPINRKIVSLYSKNYPNGKVAKLYHWFINQFFRRFPINGKLHRLMQRVFNHTFLSN